MEALERAKRRKAAKSSEPEAPAPAAPTPKSSPKSEPAEKPRADSPSPPVAKQVARLKPESKGDKPEKPEKPSKKDAADTPKDDKKRQKEAARAARKPVGRRDLKPDLTALQKIGRTGGRPSYATAAFLVIAALAGGLAAGYLKTRSALEEHVFREAELETADEAAKERNVEIYISTIPPGAKVWLDGNALADRSPLLVARPRDGEVHTLKVSLKGYDAIESQFRYEAGPLTRVSQTLKGGEVELAVYSKPSGLEVRLDGDKLGSTPLSVDVAPGPHEVEIGGGERELIKKRVVAEVGKKITLEPSVPMKGGLPSLDLKSAPTAQVFINGLPSGETNGPAFDLEPEVSHDVLLVDPNSKRRIEFKVELGTGERRRMFLDLHDAS